MLFFGLFVLLKLVVTEVDTHIKHGQSFNKVCNPYEPESTGRLLHFRVACFFRELQTVNMKLFYPRGSQKKGIFNGLELKLLVLF